VADVRLEVLLRPAAVDVPAEDSDSGEGGHDQPALPHADDQTEVPQHGDARFLCLAKGGGPDYTRGKAPATSLHWAGHLPGGHERSQMRRLTPFAFALLAVTAVGAQV